jgi:hypothetical protein
MVLASENERKFHSAAEAANPEGVRSEASRPEANAEAPRRVKAARGKAPRPLHFRGRLARQALDGDSSRTARKLQVSSTGEDEAGFNGWIQRFSRGITNFSAVCVGEKPTTFTSFSPDLRPAAITSFSMICLWPLG